MSLPDPVYIGDQVSGTLSGTHLYIDQDISPDQSILARGTFIIRYAIPALVPPGAALIPGLFVSERGQTITGRDCWDYLQTRFQLHPRAEVIGITPNGEPIQFLVRALDFGAAIQVWVYADSPDVIPLTPITLIYASDEMLASLPDLLRKYMPRG